MASVTPGYTFTGTSDPITHTKLNLVAQPTVTIGAGEVVTASLASAITITDLTVAGKRISSVDSVSTTGTTALSTSYETTKLTTGGAHALTLADGTNGQIKRVVMISDGGDGTLTPTTKTGYTTITFNDAGDAITLQFFTTQGWMVLSNNGCTVA